MTYGYIYVAQIALGANMNAVKARLPRPRLYRHGPSLIIGAPCELHGVKGGMTNCQNEMKKASRGRLLEPVHLQPGAEGRGQELSTTSKAGDVTSTGIPRHRDPLQPSDPCVPRACGGSVRKEPEGCRGSLEHLQRLVEPYKGLQAADGVRPEPFARLPYDKTRAPVPQGTGALVFMDVSAQSARLLFGDYCM